MFWRLKDFEELTPNELHGILKLRCDIFVVEQNCAYPDIDGKDPICKHFFVEDKEEIVACLRLVPPGLSFNEPSIGRFAVKKSLRGNGLGREGIAQAVKLVFLLYDGDAIRIFGQTYLREFYESFGFTVVKGPYLEDNIPHFEMLLTKEAFAASNPTE